MTPTCAKLLPGALVALTVFVAACSTPQPTASAPQPAEPGEAAEATVDASPIADAVPKPETLSAYGNPPYYEVNGRRYQVARTSKGYRERGIASWYGPKFHGKRASSGEVYDMYAMTAAHKTLPLPTYVEITNLENGQRAVVRVNDRGPFKDSRLIDLSYSAALKLGIVDKGTGLVEIRAIDPTEVSPPGPTPPEQAPPEARPRLFIQVGAFANRRNASSLRERLQGSLVPSVRIKRFTNDGKAIYRVQVGPMDTVEEVDRMAEILTKLGVEEFRMAIDWPDPG